MIRVLRGSEGALQEGSYWLVKRFDSASVAGLAGWDRTTRRVEILSPSWIGLTTGSLRQPDIPADIRSDPHPGPSLPVAVGGRG
jgi:hypothetical protein